MGNSTDYEANDCWAFTISLAMIQYIMPYVYHLNNWTVPWSLENWGLVNSMSKLVNVQVSNIANRSWSWDLKASLNFHKVNQFIQYITNTQIKKLNLTSIPENLSYPLLVTFFSYPKVSTMLTVITINLLCLFFNFI